MLNRYGVFPLPAEYLEEYLEEYPLEDINFPLLNLCGYMYETGIEDALTMIKDFVENDEELSEVAKQRMMRIYSLLFRGVWVPALSDLTLQIQRIVFSAVLT